MNLNLVKGTRAIVLSFSYDFDDYGYLYYIRNNKTFHCDARIDSDSFDVPDYTDCSEEELFQQSLVYEKIGSISFEHMVKFQQIIKKYSHTIGDNQKIEIDISEME